MNKLFYFNVEEINENNYDTLLSSLSEGNQKRVASYAVDDDRKLCLAARLLEKKFIKENIVYGSNGKPLTYENTYNISHCYPYVVIYINKYSNVGVDIEKEKEFDPKVVESCFSEVELNACPNHTKLWTYKEAYLKLYGKNIVFMRNKNPLEITEKKLNKAFYKSFEINDYHLTVTSFKKIKLLNPKQITLEELTKERKIDIEKLFNKIFNKIKELFKMRKEK